MTEEEKLTKFEEDLKTFFPDIFKLHMYSKSDKFLWSAIYSMIEMKEKDKTGDVIVGFAMGKICKLIQTDNKTAFQSNAPFLDKT